MYQSTILNYLCFKDGGMLRIISVKSLPILPTRPIRSCCAAYTIPRSLGLLASLPNCLAVTMKTGPVAYCVCVGGGGALVGTLPYVGIEPALLSSAWFNCLGRKDL